MATVIISSHISDERTAYIEYSARLVPRLMRDMKLYTKVHGKYYDLSGFVHPGGMQALSLVAGRDATEMFELHHQFSDRLSVNAILKKYEVREREFISSSDAYDWAETLNCPFTKELRETARIILGSDIKATYNRYYEYTLLFAILLSQWYCLIKGYWHAVLTFPLALWIFSANVFHDAGHFAISRNFPTINSLGMNAGFTLATPYHWYHQHTLAHHSFPNLPGKDPDLYHIPDNIRLSPDVPVSWPHSIQHWSFVFVSTFGLPGYYLCGGALQCLFGFPYNDIVPLSHTRHMHPYGGPFRLLCYLIIMHVIPVVAHGITLKSAIFAFVPEFIFMALFTICSQVNHLTPECGLQRSSNFFIHQIITSHNIHPESFLTTLFMGGLNMQIEHHLFPSVNHCHLHRLVPHVKALCRKHNVPYPESNSLWEAIRMHSEHLYNMGSKAYYDKQRKLKKIE